MGSFCPSNISFVREAELDEVRTELRVPADLVAAEFRDTSRFVDVVEYAINASSDEEPQHTLAPKCARRPPRMLLKNQEKHFWREVSVSTLPATARTGPGSPPNRREPWSPSNRTGRFSHHARYCAIVKDCSLHTGLSRVPCRDQRTKIRKLTRK